VTWKRVFTSVINDGKMIRSTKTNQGSCLEKRREKREAFPSWERGNRRTEAGILGTLKRLKGTGGEKNARDGETEKERRVKELVRKTCAVYATEKPEPREDRVADYRRKKQGKNKANKLSACLTNGKPLA